MWTEEQEPPKLDDQNCQEEVEEESDPECTNVPALVLCIIFVGVTLGFATYCGMNGEVGILALPKDGCGNICGKLYTVNLEKLHENCTAKDMRKLPKLLTTVSKSKIERERCVEKCPDGYTESLNRCIGPGQKIGDLQEIQQSFAKSWYLILIICFVAFVFSYICLLLYRYCAKYVIWIINIGFIIFTIVLGVFFLFVMKDMKTGLCMCLLSLISIVVLIIFRREIALVAAIFKESSKALMDVPAIMFEPILTFIVLLISFVAFIFFIILIEAAKKTDLRDDKYSGTLIASHIFNGIAFIWFTQFIFGCQHFIIAGTVSKWYFGRDKAKLGSPICATFKQLTRYHLGSVCLGSMLITLVKILKMIVNAIKRAIEKDSESQVSIFLACFCACIIDTLDRALQYLVRNAYIVIALDGTPFFESGKRAFNLIKDNLEHCYSVNQFGDIVLAVCRLLITLIAGFVGYEILGEPGLEDSMFFPLVVAIVFAFFIAHCFVTVFEMTVDTVFICYCIDMEENGGEGNPYYMSDKLRKVMMQLEGFESDSVQEDGDASNMPMQPQPYPGQPMPDQQPYYQEQNGYPGQQPGYQDPGFPPQGPYIAPQGPYPAPQGPPQPYGQPNYPTAGDPSQQPFYPQQPIYPGQQPQYPGPGPIYPTLPDQNSQQSYPDQLPEYPGQQPQYPGQQPQYPGQQPQYPGQPQYSDPSMPPQQQYGQANYPQAQAGYPPQSGYGPPPPGYPQQPPY